jgi:predicted O-methyltransferase YrrM
MKVHRFLLPATYIKRLRRAWFQSQYDRQVVRAEEKAKFVAAGLDYDLGIKALNDCLSEMGQPSYLQNSSMASVHWLLFACLRQRIQPQRILEIGTYDGQTTALLAHLFPRSEIVTVELPASDPILHQTYGRHNREKMAEFERTLAANTAAANVVLLKTNSFFLPAAVQGAFDLIWVDGGHLYPEVAWDLCNAYHLVREGGYVMCDDVITNPKSYKDSYVSPDSHQVLQYICHRTSDSLALFLKREDPRESADPRARKFVALLQKGSGPESK